MPFRVMDWNWGPYYVDPYHNPMSVTSTTVEAAMFDQRPFLAIERFSVTETGEYTVSGVWSNSEDGDWDGAEVSVMINGDVIASSVVSNSTFEWSQTLSLRAGDNVDFAVGPNEVAGLDWVDRDITILGP